MEASGNGGSLSSGSLSGAGRTGNNAPCGCGFGGRSRGGGRCCRMASTNWSISERTVPLAFGRNRFGEMNGEFARSNRRFAPFYARKGSSVTIMRPETDALQA